MVDIEGIERLDMSQYCHTGEGANGSSYDSLLDPEYMVKLYNEGYHEDAVIEELEIAEKVYGLGVETPEPGCLVTDGKRIGIRFRRIAGKRSYSRMLADEPERLEEFTRDFARRCKKIHSTVCPEGLFQDVKEQSLTYLAANRLEPELSRRIAAFIESVPDSATALHGDMQIGNAISTLPAGAPLTTPHNVYFIDLGTFAHGYPLFDLGMMQNICLTADEEFRREAFHLTGEVTREVWRVFKDEYFFAEDRLADKLIGPGQTPESVDRALMPYQCCKLLLVGFNIGAMPPHYLKILEDTFYL